MLLFTILIPNILRLRKEIWLIIKSSLFLIFIAMIILFSDASLETFFFLGSYLGMGFLITGLIYNSRLSLIFFLVSFLSFSLVFLSIGQTIFFIVCVCYVYILMIGFIVFLLFKDKMKDAFLPNPKITQTSGFIILLVLPIISIYVLTFLVKKELVHFDPISLLDLFYQNYEILALLIVLLVFLLIMIIVFIIEFRNNKQRSDEAWFT